jgi:ring-1,2-phenylacetyl-CoA epoxidase subunit PaaC
VTALADNLRHPLAELLLAVADDKLMLGHRNSDWTGLAPILEEDIAFSSIAQDEIAHAQALYELAGELLDTSADALAFGRDPEAYRCCAIVEIPDDFDWAFALARQLFCDHYDALRLQRLAQSSHAPLAALARRLHAEERVHVDHADSWVRRLGRGSDDARDRMQAALDALAPMAGMLCEPVEGVEGLEAAGVYPALPGEEMFEQWRRAVTEVTTDAGLTIEVAPPAGPGGRRGHHTKHLPVLLDEMCAVYRLAPNAAW